ncbi:EYxxD motif small membrane protein [Fictibacillus nanhaiensis]
MSSEYFMDTAFLYILLVGSIIAITFVFIKKRRTK